MTPLRLVLAVAACTVLATGCAGKKPAAQLAPLPDRPFAGLAGQQVIVLPAHYVRPADSLGWASQIHDARTYLRTVDDELAFALGERGFRTLWVFPDRLAREAHRNAGYAVDPYGLAAEGLRPGMTVPADGEIREPLGSQIRSLLAMSEARYALLPVEIRFEKLGPTTGRAMLRMALIDGRLRRVRWLGDIPSDPADKLSPAVAASIASHFADLIVAP